MIPPGRFLIIRQATVPVHRAVVVEQRAPAVLPPALCQFVSTPILVTMCEWLLYAIYGDRVGAFFAVDRDLFAGHRNYLILVGDFVYLAVIGK